MEKRKDVAAESNFESRVIVQVLKKSGHSQKNIAKAAGVSESKVSHIVRLKRGAFTKEEKANIEQNLGVDLKKLMKTGTGGKYTKVKKKISEFQNKLAELIQMVEDLLEDETKGE